MRKICLYYTGLLCMLLMAACSNTKKIPAGDALYTGATIKITDEDMGKKKKKSLKSDLGSLTRPRPNKKILGVRFKLSMYNLAGNPKKERSPAAWLKNKVGEPPVLLSDVNLDRNAQVLKSELENTGYFKAVVTADTTVKKKMAKATYTVTAGPQYTISEVIFEKDSSILSRTIDSSAKESLLKKDEPFDLGAIKAERERIDNYLKERGFYYFAPDYLIIQTDSTIGGNKVNLYVKTKKQAPPEVRQVYRINDVYIFPSFRLNSTASGDTLKSNAAFYKGYYVVDRRKLYKPRMFEQSMQFDPGDVYNRTDHNLSINRLVNLNVFKFVKNRFEVLPDADTPRLNAYYYLTPMPKKSIRSEVNGTTKSNNLTGSSITVGWRNRNTFKGGELFAIDATGGFEVQFSGQLRGYNTYRYGLEGNLTFPRFLVPFVQINTKGGFVPKTNIKLGYDLLTKQKLYTMNSFRAEFGYNWKENIYKEHQFNPIAINYVQPVKVTPMYTDSAKRYPALLKAIEKQFILGTNYNYNYNQLQGNITTGLYLNGNLDLSGNVAGLVSGANTKAGKTKYIAGAQFSQYIKAEGDIRHYLQVGGKTTIWANRLIAGLGYPYGNSLSLPFVKQFFVGGTNSIRAFRSRSLGPGTFKDTTFTTFLPDQSGDIKLEINTELRAKLFSIVHGAIFVDAGNIWLYNKDTATINPKIGGEFTGSFLKELAVGAGVGLRFDISFLVLRLDLAIPLRKPWLPDGDRWVIDRIKFSDPAWRKENLIFNLGIGYPF